MKLIQDLGLDKKNSFELEIVELASKNAAAVALQGGAVDLIVTDWFWVSRQRNENRLFSFIPHSMAAGGLIASKKSSIKNKSLDTYDTFEGLPQSGANDHVEKVGLFRHSIDEDSITVISLI